MEIIYQIVRMANKIKRNVENGVRVYENRPSYCFSPRHIGQ